MVEVGFQTSWLIVWLQGAIKTTVPINITQTKNRRDYFAMVTILTNKQLEMHAMGSILLLLIPVAPFTNMV